MENKTFSILRTADCWYFNPASAFKNSGTVLFLHYWIFNLISRASQ